MEPTEPNGWLGVLAGTSSEAEPGVGGTGDHPAPAVMVDPATGNLRQHGEPVDTAGDQSPRGDSTDRPSGDVVTDPEARARLNAGYEPEQVHTERQDIGTPE